MRALADAALATVRASLDPVVFAEAFATGQQLSLEEAFATILAPTQPASVPTKASAIAVQSFVRVSDFSWLQECTWGQPMAGGMRWCSAVARGCAALCDTDGEPIELLAQCSYESIVTTAGSHIDDATCAAAWAAGAAPMSKQAIAEALNR